MWYGTRRKIVNGWDLDLNGGNFQSKNLKPIINSTAIQFRIRCDSGEFYKVPMFFALVDYAEKQCFSKLNLLNIDGGKIDQQWRKVLIPLSTFKFEKKE